MPVSPKVGQSTLELSVAQCPLCRETYQPAISHHTCPPVADGLPEHVAERIHGAREYVRDFPQWAPQEGNSRVIVYLADRLAAREREYTQRQGSIERLVAAAHDANEVIAQLRARAEQAERERDALRALALRSYKRVDVRAGELVQFLACYVLNWDAHSDPECGFREISEETVAAAISSACGATA